MKRGLLIAIEGIDGAGTTTQSARLKEVFLKRGRQVHTTCEPTSDVIGKLIRLQLKHSDSTLPMSAEALALLYAADRIHHCKTEIEPNLAKGIDVITDRYLLSSLVYQGLNLPVEWLLMINRYAHQPDLTVIVDVSVQTGNQRIAQRGGDKEIFDALATQELLRNRYLELAGSQNAVVVDGDADPDTVTQRLLDVIQIF